MVSANKVGFHEDSRGGAAAAGGLRGVANSLEARFDNN